MSAPVLPPERVSMSTAKRGLLRNWLAVAESEDPIYEVRRYGLCTGLWFVAETKAQKLAAKSFCLFIQDLAEFHGINPFCPFNTARLTYNEESASLACHKNPHRLAWVKANV